MDFEVLVILTARDEAERIGATIAALKHALPSARLWVADDGSRDSTPQIACSLQAELVRNDRALGKGAAATRAAGVVLESGARDDAIVLLCDADLGESAQLLVALVDELRSGKVDLAVARFATARGGGLGLARAFARWAIRHRCGLQMYAPISGQRALSAGTLRGLLPFADGFGMEIGMTIDAVRQGRRVGEVELDLAHRRTGRTPAGILHRGRQLLDFVRVYRARR
jgi:glycosyltransferase involved in cell wall biosynthesis